LLRRAGAPHRSAGHLHDRIDATRASPAIASAPAYDIDRATAAGRMHRL